MILYLDASALVKEYLVGEPGSRDIAAARLEANLVGTSAISRAETAAAFAKAVRTKALTRDEALTTLERFRGDWPDLSRISVSDAVLTRADVLAWEENLRGFDAVHLASAVVWRDGLSTDIVFAAYDVRLWRAAGRLQFIQFPEDLPTFIAEST